MVQQLSDLGYRWCYREVDLEDFSICQTRTRLLICASLNHDPRRVLLTAQGAPVSKSSLPSAPSAPRGFPLLDALAIQLSTSADCGVLRDDPGGCLVPLDADENTPGSCVGAFGGVCAACYRCESRKPSASVCDHNRTSFWIGTAVSREPMPPLNDRSYAVCRSQANEGASGRGHSVLFRDPRRMVVGRSCQFSRDVHQAIQTDARSGRWTNWPYGIAQPATRGSSLSPPRMTPKWPFL
jgi:hypothetical protein